MKITYDDRFILLSSLRTRKRVRGDIVTTEIAEALPLPMWWWDYIGGETPFSRGGDV